MIGLQEFAKAAILSYDCEETHKQLMNTFIRGNGGPRDKKFRESVLTLVVLLQQLAVKSELLPDAGLELMQGEVDRQIAGTRGVMVAEGVQIPEGACRERLMKYPDKQVGIMFEHGEIVPYENCYPKGYEEAFRTTVGDVMTVHLKTKGSKGVVAEDHCRADLESRTLFCVKCGKEEPFVSNLVGEFQAQMDAFRAAHAGCK